MRIPEDIKNYDKRFNTKRGIVFTATAGIENDIDCVDIHLVLPDRSYKYLFSVFSIDEANQFILMASNSRHY